MDKWYTSARLKRRPGLLKLCSSSTQTQLTRALITQTQLTRALSTRALTVVAAFILPLATASASNSQSEHPSLVSLAPSNTEIIAALGATDELVGVSTYCDYPPEVKAISKAGSFISADMERMTRLKPDSILLVSGQEQLAAKLQHNHFKTLLLKNEQISDIPGNIKQLGEITHKQQKARELIDRFNKCVVGLESIVKSSKQPCKVFYCVWPSPLMTAGKSSFLNNVITTCGGTNIAGDLAQAYPTYSLEKLILTDPDMIIMPFEARGQSFIKKAPWTSLKAVKLGRVYYLPDAKKDMLARPTMRLLSGIAWLTDKIHPELKQSIANWQKKWSITTMP